MPRLSWKVQIALILTGVALLLTLLHILFFNDPQTLFFYLALDIVFVPIQVLLVSIVIEHLLREREKEGKLHRLNMVIGAFMGEVGAHLLRDINKFRVESDAFDAALQVDSSWKRNDYRTAQAAVARFDGEFAPQPDDLERLRTLLLQRRPFVLALLQNANLMEHEPFTNLLWAICHLTEELECRPGFSALPPHDLEHLRGDIRRAYGLLAGQWLSSMQHLQRDYPYIFSLSVRTNPFNPQATAIID